MSAPLPKILGAARLLSQRAGAIIVSTFNSGTDLGLVNKSNAKEVLDPQTVADRKSQQLICDSLRKGFPGLKIVGEEGNLEPNADLIVPAVEWDTEEMDLDAFPEDLKSVALDDIVCWVDPLDGTKEFTQGIKEGVTVLIGIAVKGTPCAGVIHQPFYECTTDEGMRYGRTVWGAVGFGVRGIEPRKPPIYGRRILALTRSHMTDELQRMVDAIGPTEILKGGGSGHKILWILEGKADVYVHVKGTSRWDTCAGEALLRAIGGSLTDHLGCAYDYHVDSEHANKYGLIASACDHEYYVEKVEGSIAGKL